MVDLRPEKDLLREYADDWHDQNIRNSFRRVQARLSFDVEEVLAAQSSVRNPKFAILYSADPRSLAVKL
jgi:hypothetical protein